MKLIIDIPDRVYDMLTEYQALPENIDLEYFVIHSIPLEEELEKIKAEFSNLQKAHHIWLIDQDALIDECSEIINKHISELKGEQK